MLITWINSRSCATTSEEKLVFKLHLITFIKDDSIRWHIFAKWAWCISFPEHPRLFSTSVSSVSSHCPLQHYGQRQNCPHDLQTKYGHFLKMIPSFDPFWSFWSLLIKTWVVQYSLQIGIFLRDWKWTISACRWVPMVKRTVSSNGFFALLPGSHCCHVQPIVISTLHGMFS